MQALCVGIRVGIGICKLHNVTHMHTPALPAQAHLDRCIEAQEQHNTSAQAVERMSSLLADSTELQAALSSPLTKCRVQVRERGCGGGG